MKKILNWLGWYKVQSILHRHRMSDWVRGENFGGLIRWHRRCNGCDLRQWMDLPWDCQS